VQDNDEITCNVQQVISNQQGQQVILDKVNVDLNKPGDAEVIITIAQGNQIIGSEIIQPGIISVDNNEKIESYYTPDSNFPYEVLIINNKGTYQTIIADPLLAKSAFTMLYYFDGKYMDGYEKISDKTSFTGQKILVYKVDLTT
jgi:hypothetical protein